MCAAARVHRVLGAGLVMGGRAVVGSGGEMNTETHLR